MRQSILFTLFTLLSIVTAHNVLLPSNGKRCFFEELKKNDELALSFQYGNRDSRATDQLTGDFWITSPSGRILKQEVGVSHGDVQIKASDSGKYGYCFSNEYSSIDTKDVSFNIHGVVYIDVNDPESNSLDAAVRRLSVLASEVKNEQGYIVVRERTHRNTAESTNDRVKYWSIFQLIVVAANAVFQIYYLKRFFEVKSVV
ncbi:Endosomal protein P24B [Wickerhamomyces ciferrii]|uniref:Endosomal protein P24B n=1 Tax=Wickerhamomyces ciferrii (strain ATCC 14091 / BCRC 22168 / CBS 111 / JCM 3599 / NBRC 0793 / NRRL Y-1031 F-60-10) TaxID=1206466 RepID=K0KNY9_WICCF|nr:Endosomal protein P24B [Wickerhamomyces ciferrii]CCH43114.1 Endosomal protein P24B [Wickerhamomyces ciferrii]